MSTPPSTTIYIGGSPPGGNVGTVGAVHIHIGCENSFPTTPATAPTLRPGDEQGETEDVVVPAPQLDPGTTNIIWGLANKELGKVLVFLEPENTGIPVEYWVAKDTDALGIIKTGAFFVRCADTTSGTFATNKAGLKNDYPNGVWARAPLNYQTPPPAQFTPANNVQSTQRFVVLSGAGDLPEVSGGMFREILPNNAGYNDHWRLHRNYVFPKATGGAVGSSMILVPAYPTGTLAYFRTTHANGGGSYVKAEYASNWTAL